MEISVDFYVAVGTGSKTESEERIAQAQFFNRSCTTSTSTCSTTPTICCCWVEFCILLQSSTDSHIVSLFRRIFHFFLRLTVDC